MKPLIYTLSLSELEAVLTPEQLEAAWQKAAIKPAASTFLLIASRMRRLPARSIRDCPDLKK